jgi:hypothetical protein
MDKCSRCGQPIKGDLEQLTAISDANGTTAHFYCYYPQGTEDRSLQLPKWALQRIAHLSPERARFFHA